MRLLFNHSRRCDGGLVNRKFYEVMSDKIRIYRLIGCGHEKKLFLLLRSFCNVDRKFDLIISC